MRIGAVEFRPPIWAVVLVLVLFTLLLGLGTWQVRRGQAKAQIIAERAAAGKMPAAPLSDTIGHGNRRRVVVKGVYLADRQLLLDNQVHQGRAGYHVWTPLRRVDHRGVVLVDRGWVPLGRNRAQPPTPSAPEGQVTVTGLWRAWPEPGLRLGDDSCGGGSWPRVVEYPTYKQVSCNYDAPVADGLLLLQEGAAGGFPRNWQDVGLPPMRHYGYAVQWYAMALALLIIFFFTNTRKVE